jgi:hypothetical protein
MAAPTTAELGDTLWKAADKLRGSMDAAQYKDFVLGLVFLKYVSDAFVERRERIREEVLSEGIDEARLAQFVEDEDEYTREGVFWVPEGARWDRLAAQAKSAGVGELIDNAMDVLMKTNLSLTGVLPKIFNRDNVDQRRLGELVDLISDARFTGHGDKPARDVLGEVYEYFLEKFARAEGKRGGEFYTPATVVRLLVGVLEPYAGRVYDPCCGSGGMFVQAEKFVLAHRGRRDDIAVYGQESNERTWRLAQMNLAIHGVNGDLATPTCGPTTFSPTRRSTCRIGRAGRTILGGGSALRQLVTLTSPGFSTSSRSSPSAAPRAWSSPTARCRPSSPARARSALRWSRPTWSPAWWRSRHSSSGPPRSRPACGSSPRTKPRKARSA